jgi:phage tail-like protein
MSTDIGATATPQGEMMPVEADAGSKLISLLATGADGPAATGRVANRDSAAVVVDHVADFNRRYPGESVTLYTRVYVREPIPGFAVRILVPAGLELSDYHSAQSTQQPIFRRVATTHSGELRALPGADGTPFPLVAPGSSEALATTVYGNEMIWMVAEAQPGCTTHEFEFCALPLPTRREERLVSSVTVQTLAGERLVAESAEIAIYPKGHYLGHLPALFEQDDFMGRFLMLFESFWGPISRQIDALPHYLDPALTPARFLPWLASWFDLEFDDTWSEAQRRELLRSIMWLYRRRGTRVALQRYLEIYTGQPVVITERRARNLRLGPTARLGVGVALGTGNVPHTFTVRVRLPAITPPAELDAEAAAKEIARLDKQRRRRLEQLIEADKPAHTSYHLEIIEIPAAA